MIVLSLKYTQMEFLTSHFENCLFYSTLCVSDLAMLWSTDGSLLLLSYVLGVYRNLILCILLLRNTVCSFHIFVTVHIVSVDMLYKSSQVHSWVFWKSGWLAVTLLSRQFPASARTLLSLSHPRNGTLVYDLASPSQRKWLLEFF